MIPAGLAAATWSSVCSRRCSPTTSSDASRACLRPVREGGARLATVPATLAEGTRTALEFIRHPRSGALAIGGAIGFWAANIAILWASFHAFDVHIPLGVVVQGFFLGMLANLLPFAPGGVGAVDAGMIGAFVLFGLPSTEVFAAVLTYRVIAFWLPIPPGIVAFFQLRKTVRRWESEGREQPEPLDVGEPETARAG